MEKRRKNWQIALAINDDEEQTPSYFLQSLIEANILGLITDNEAEQMLLNHLQENNLNEQYSNDLVTLRIKRLLTIKDFKLNQNYLCAIHKYIFKDVFPHAGQIRTINLSKKEPCLNKDSVIYATSEEIPGNLAYDFYYETQKIKRRKQEISLPSFCKFISNLWQTHPFYDGNTRTISVFTQKYLNYLGYPTNNDVFISNSTYFRNALVRSNPTTLDNYSYTDEYLLKFFDKLLFNPDAVLDIKETYISYTKI